MTHNVLSTFSGRTNAPVMFVTADAITSGNWTNLYGTNYIIVDSTPITNLPAYAQVTVSNQQLQVWTNQATDPRALLKPSAYTNRIAAAWTTADSQNSAFTIDINLAAGHTNQVALYCSDWLATGTIVEKLEVFEASDTSYSNPLDARHFLLPPNGVYIVWKLSGHKTIRVTKQDAVAGNKALVSAVFFCPP
jgi:hypothetical protein